VDLRNQDRVERDLLEEKRFRNANDCIQYYVHEGRKSSTKKDVYHLLDLEGFFTRRVFFTSDAKRELGVLEGSV
jgi:hypothetical protein